MLYYRCNRTPSAEEGKEMCKNTSLAHYMYIGFGSPVAK